MNLDLTDITNVKDWFFAIPKVEDAQQMLTQIAQNIANNRNIETTKELFSPGPYLEIFEESMNDKERFLQERGRLFLFVEHLLHKDNLSTFETPKMEGWFRDLRTVPCPLNMIKAKVEISKMPKGELLTLWLDAGSPIENVPRGLLLEGHTIIGRKNRSEFWQLELQIQPQML